MTTHEWKALIRMTTSSSTNTYHGHYKGVPIEVTSNSTLTRDGTMWETVHIHCNHDNVVSPKTFTMDDELPLLYRNVFRALYDTWHAFTIDNLPF
jgi:hypothetical protein